MTRMFTLLVPLALLACNKDKGDDTAGPVGGDDTSEVTCADDDSDCDGVPDDADCDPNDPYTYPGATEIPYDGKDNDCAGDGDLTDVDGDGYDGSMIGGDDCNDGNPEIYPGAPEICYDGVDEDCDGEPVQGEAETNDCDGDGFDGRGENATDCNDEDPAVNPEAVEIWYDGIDGDCTGPYSSDYDADGDEDDSSDYGGGDCDDTDPLTNSEADELWDGVDRDCDGTIDSMSVTGAYQAFYANTMSDDVWFGFTTFAVDDYDGDGLKEVGGCGPLSGADKAYQGWCHIFATGGDDGTPPDVAYTSVHGTDGTYLGFDTANLGDLDGDGYAELAIGSLLYGGSGAALIFSGATLAGGGTMYGSSALASLEESNYTGADVAAVGDLDGDGVMDIAAGSGNWLLATDLSLSIWSGSEIMAGGTYGAADAMVSVAGTSQGGETVGGADLDGDGIADLVVGTQTTAAGRVTVIPGVDLTGGLTLSPADYDQLMGESSTTAGLQNAVVLDVTGDGLAEIAVSAPDTQGGLGYEGAVYLVNGDDAVAGGDLVDVATTTLVGTTPYGRLITSGETSADFDGDGVQDLVVAYAGGSALGSIRGVVHAMNGLDLAAGGSIDVDETTDFGTFPSRQYDENLGYSSVAWDMDGDGDQEIALGGYGNNDVGMMVVFMSGWAD